MAVLSGTFLYVLVSFVLIFSMPAANGAFLGIISILGGIFGFLAIKFFPAKIGSFYNFSKKDLILFSTLAIYFLLIFIGTTFTAITNERCDLSYDVYDHYSPSGFMPVAEEKYYFQNIAQQYRMACLYKYLGIIFLFLIFLAVISFFFFMFLKFILLILLLLGSRRVNFIKFLLSVNLRIKKTYYNFIFSGYPLDENSYIKGGWLMGYDKKMKIIEQRNAEYYKIMQDLLTFNT